MTKPFPLCLPSVFSLLALAACANQPLVGKWTFDKDSLKRDYERSRADEVFEGMPSHMQQEIVSAHEKQLAALVAESPSLEVFSDGTCVARTAAMAERKVEEVGGFWMLKGKYVVLEFERQRVDGLLTDNVLMIQIPGTSAMGYYVRR